MKQLSLTALFLLQMSLAKGMDRDWPIENQSLKSHADQKPRALTNQDKRYFKDNALQTVTVLGLLGATSLYVGYGVWNSFFREYSWLIKNRQFSDEHTIGWPLTKKLLDFLEKYGWKFQH